MYFPSYNLPENASFLDIIRLLDKVQYKTKVHLLDSQDVKKALYIQEEMKKYCSLCYVDVISAYSVKGYAYKSHCTMLSLTPKGGSVRRCIAPEERHGKGPRFVIILQNYNRDFPVIKDFYIVYKDVNLVRLKSLN